MKTSWPDCVVVTEEEHYTVDAMTVTLEVEQGVVIDSACECEEYAEYEKNTFLNGRDERCKHIRNAEMYRYYNRRVSPNTD